MTNAQLPKGVDAIIKMFRLCLEQYRHVKAKKGREFNAEERESWKWLDEAINTSVIEAQIAELDKDTSDYVYDLQLQVAEAIHPREKEAVAAPTLFDGMSEDAA